jgi:signal transduction histidine kinase
MQVRDEHRDDEIKRLQRCINDLVSLLALRAAWRDSEPAEIVHRLLDTLLGMLRLDLVYMLLKDPPGDAPIEMVRVAQPHALMPPPQEICVMLNQLFGDDPAKWRPVVRSPMGDGDISIVPVPLGLQAEIGVVAAGSQRPDFPGQTEKLLLRVASNQALIRLQEARLLHEQKRVARELDQRVAQRAVELAAANEELRKEIVERTQAEEKLRRSEAFLAEAQRLSSTGSFSWRVATDEVTWSEQLFRIFEFDRALPVTLQRISACVHREDLPLFQAFIDRARAEGSDFESELRLQMPDGTIKYVHTIAHGIRDRGGRLEYIGAVQDVTQRRLSEEALGKARSELAHVSRVLSLGALTASIAHEVNQPLSGVITNASTCMRMLSADPPNLEGARETARRIIRDGNRASDVITRLRALYGKKDVSTESVDLNEATREVLALSSNELQRNRVMLRTEFADDLPLVTGDRVQLQQVILNLLRNAADAMGTVEDRPRELLVRTERDETDGIRLSVQDTGVGFEAEAADRLFGAFYTTKHDGMGMGLSVSRSIIENHHGRLWAALNSGAGATFSFSIPRGYQSSEGNTLMRGPVLIAVVDDDESVRESLPNLLRELGFAAHAFASAEEFLMSGYVDRARCLILDVAMPGMSGPNLQQELQRRRKKIPIVFITAHRDEAVPAGLSERGAVECLFKPFSERALVEALNVALRTN